MTPAFCVRPAATWTTSVLSMGSRSGALSPPPHVYTDDSGGGMAGRAGPRGTPAGTAHQARYIGANAAGTPVVAPLARLTSAPSAGGPASCTARGHGWPSGQGLLCPVGQMRWASGQGRSQTKAERTGPEHPSAPDLPWVPPNPCFPGPPPAPFAAPASACGHCPGPCAG